MAYLYRHIRLDKNQPFYIGIGSDSSFKRAFEKTRRSQLWNKIVSKTSYEVEIIFDNLTWEEACKKEIEFISIYGRKDLGTGVLVNLTDGGEGALGRKYIASQETKEKLRKSHLGFKHSDETKLKHSLIRKGKKFTEKHLLELKESAKKRDYKEQGLKAADKILKTMNVKPIRVYNNDNFIGEFVNRRICRETIGISKTMLYELLKDENKVCKGYQIKLK